MINQTALANNGIKIGLLCGAGTCMASWFYAMACMIRQRWPILAAVHSVQFRDLTLPARAELCVKDIMDKKCGRLCIHSFVQCGQHFVSFDSATPTKQSWINFHPNSQDN